MLPPHDREGILCIVLECVLLQLQGVTSVHPPHSISIQANLNLIGNHVKLETGAVILPLTLAGGVLEPPLLRLGVTV